MNNKLRQELKKVDFLRDNYIFWRSFKEVMNEKPKLITIYATNRCNSACNNCFIWKQQPKIDLDIEVLKKLLTDKLITRDTSFVLQGGEFILHPNYKEILQLFKNKKVTLLSNGILAEQIIDVCKQYDIKFLALSLDGRPETNLKIRGKDAFSSIEKIIRSLKNTHVGIAVTYTICSLNNNLDDFLFVKNFCNKNNVNFNVVTYGDQFYFECEKKYFKIDSGIINNVGDKFLKKYLELYNREPENRVKRCFSIKRQTTIWPNGDITLCQQKNIVLGNIYKESLSKIWNKEQAKELRKEFSYCNECWLGCHRPFDVEMLDNPGILSKIFKKTLL